MSTDWTEGERRHVYFYSVSPVGGEGRAAVVCPACFDGMTLSDASWIKAHYTADRAMRCSHCLVWIGPINEKEGSRE